MANHGEPQNVTLYNMISTETTVRGRSKGNQRKTQFGESLIGNSLRWNVSNFKVSFLNLSQHMEFHMSCPHLAQVSQNGPPFGWYLKESQKGSKGYQCINQFRGPPFWAPYSSTGLFQAWPARFARRVTRKSDKPNCIVSGEQ